MTAYLVKNAHSICLPRLFGLMWKKVLATYRSLHGFMEVASMSVEVGALL